MNLFDSTSSSSSEDEDEVLFLRRPKIYNIKKNYLEIYDELDFFQRFRITKDTFRTLFAKIENLIRPATNRGGSIQPVIQVLLALGFYACGNMQKSCADFSGVSTSSACRIIRKVTEAIATLRPHYINMYETNAELNRSAEAMYQITRFPRVIGAIDCTLIKTQSPGGEEAEIYRTRKNCFGINVQTVSDRNLCIRDLVARWPGSAHDQAIFNNSSLKRRFEDGRYGNFILVGDSGYQLKPYLMTKLQNVHTPAENLYNESIIRTRNVVELKPYLMTKLQNVKPYLMTKLQNVHTPAENLYNESIIRTRNVVERQYGVWKRRFPLLQLGMRLKIETVLNIIVATAILHNMALEEKEDIAEEWLEEIEDEDLEIKLAAIDENALNARRLIINEHFARL
ncbi:DDE superfamily endonuclease [Popillia japonica]|uniref:DDE superfamily endonuclease n=1 Tax=Popillia japonica TaxID=7064 RepID=A0AAW1IDA2_POPJA